MTTPIELMNLALKQAGVLGLGQTATPEDTADTFKILNMMLAQWSIRRNIVFQIVDTAFTGTGAATYTVGPGAQFNIPRPPNLISAYCRQLGTPGLPVDYGLDLIHSATDFGRISLKTMSSMPQAVWYEPTYPTGTLHVWPLPTNSYEIHIQTLVPLKNFATAYDDLLLPGEYEEAIVLNLAGRLCVHYALPMPMGLAELAAASLEAIRAANVQISKLIFPRGLSRQGAYNFYSDR